VGGIESESGDEVLVLRPGLGEEETVVTVVVAVRGRSADTEEMASWEDGGSFPVSSNFRIRDLRSSSSSQTVEGAVVDSVDSVPSCRGRSGSPRGRSVVSELDGCRLLRIVDSVEWRYDRGSCKEPRLSIDVSGETSGVIWLSLLRGKPIVDLELET
jgi:hypothetical protein